MGDSASKMTTGAESRFTLRPNGGSQFLKLNRSLGDTALLGDRDPEDRFQMLVLKLHDVKSMQFFLHFDQWPMPRLGALVDGRVAMHGGQYQNIFDGDTTWQLVVLDYRATDANYIGAGVPATLCLDFEHMRGHALLVAFLHVRSRRFMAVVNGAVRLGRERRHDEVLIAEDSEQWDMECVGSDFSASQWMAGIALAVTVVTGIALAAAAPAIAVAGVAGLGFETGGIVAGSTAAGMMSAAGPVAAGSTVAVMQSIGATGSLAALGAAAAAVPVVGGAVGATIGASAAAVASISHTDLTQTKFETLDIRGSSHTGAPLLFGPQRVSVLGGTNLSKDLLSCRADGLVDLYSHDDSSGRQRWIFEPLGHHEGGSDLYRISISGGTHEGKSILSCSPEGFVGLWGADDNSGRQKWLVRSMASGSTVFNIEVFGGTNEGKRFLSCTPCGNVDLWEKDDASGRQRWRLHAIG